MKLVIFKEVVKMRKARVMLLSLMLLSACTAKEETASTNESELVSHAVVSSQESVSASQETSSTTIVETSSLLRTEESVEGTSATESPAEKSKRATLEAYNELPLHLKVLLATTTVDERGETPGLQGYALSYNFEGEQLLVTINSGAGSGHPWFILHYDDEFIYPVEGVTYVSAHKVEAVAVNQRPVAKVDLYQKYLANQGDYDSSLENVQQSDFTSLESYQNMKELID